METTRTRVLCLVLSLAPCGSFEDSAGPANIPYFFTSIRARGVVRQRSVQTLLPPSSPAFFCHERDAARHPRALEGTLAFLNDVVYRARPQTSSCSLRGQSLNIY